MEMTREKYEEIKKQHATLLLLDEDLMECLKVAQELLAAEAEATEMNEPQAINTIMRLHQAEEEVYIIQQEIENEEFKEDSKE